MNSKIISKSQVSFDMRRFLREAVKLNHSLARIHVFGEVAPTRDSELSPTTKAKTFEFGQRTIKEIKIVGDSHEIDDRFGRKSTYRGGTDMMNGTKTRSQGLGELLDLLVGKLRPGCGIWLDLDSDGRRH